LSSFTQLVPTAHAKCCTIFVLDAAFRTEHGTFNIIMVACRYLRPNFGNSTGSLGTRRSKEAALCRNSYSRVRTDMWIVTAYVFMIAELGVSSKPVRGYLSAYLTNRLTATISPLVLNHRGDAIRWLRVFSSARFLLGRGGASIRQRHHPRMS